jgi:uncharacterized protein (DUF849 family)
VEIAEIRRIKACLNGKRSAAEHPAVPVSASQLADAAAGAVAAGAEAVHVHPRDAAGEQSLLAGDVGTAVAAIRAACPATPVGVTTGLWAAADARARQQQVAAWADLDDLQRPDFASVNLSEEGWAELTETLAAAGIRPEAGVWSVDDVDALAGFEPRGGWLRILVEIMDVPGAEAPQAADQVLARIEQAGLDVPVVVHGEDQGCWPLIVHAGRLGLPVRIGLEDVLTGPSGETVAGNAELVRLALGVWSAAAGGEGAAGGGSATAG